MNKVLSIILKIHTQRVEKDEFILPAAFNGYEGFLEGDAVLTLNFRSDRMRQFATALGDEQFKGFERKFIPIDLATMTQYDKSFPYPVLFPKDAPEKHPF